MTGYKTHVVRDVGVGLAAGVLLAGCGGSSESGGDDGAGDSPSTHESSAPVESSGGQVSQQKAGRVATDKYGGTVISVESDSHHGEKTWEVEIKGSKKGRIEVDVSKSTGKIVAFEHDDD